jgi:hypothetical protein
MGDTAGRHTVLMPMNVGSSGSSPRQVKAGGNREVAGMEGGGHCSFSPVVERFKLSLRRSIGLDVSHLLVLSPRLRCCTALLSLLLPLPYSLLLPPLLLLLLLLLFCLPLSHPPASVVG